MQAECGNEPESRSTGQSVNVGVSSQSAQRHTRILAYKWNMHDAIISYLCPYLCLQTLVELILAYCHPIPPTGL